MRIIIVSGELTENADILTNANGEKQLHFILCNKEIGKNNNETYFFEVLYPATNESRLKLVKHLKRGTVIIINGEFVEDAENDKTFIKADNIYFNPNKKKL